MQWKKGVWYAMNGGKEVSVVCIPGVYGLLGGVVHYGRTTSISSPEWSGG